MNDLMKQCAASGQMSARQIADEMAESRAEAPAGELTDEQIEKIAKPYSRTVGDYGCNETAIPDNGNIEDFARAIIAADRALREPGQISSAALSNKAFFDWWPFAFDPECDAMALRAWNAASAAKDADYALGVSMLRTEITTLKTQLTHDNQEIQAYDLTMDRQAREIEGLTAERDAAQVASRYETDLCEQAITDLAKITAERDALRKDAERYRWLRARDLPWLHRDHPASMVSTRWSSGHAPDEIDAAIDAAMTKEPK